MVYFFLKTSHIFDYYTQVLLFSQMTRLLDVLEEYLDWRGFTHMRLDGSTKSDDRANLLRVCLMMSLVWDEGCL